MKAVILNSGIGSRMGDASKEYPKCMTRLGNGQTLLSRQLTQLKDYGIYDILITTGPFAKLLEEHAVESAPGLSIQFVNNPRYMETNYIYSLYHAREYLVDTKIMLLHGDLVFEPEVLAQILGQKTSSMVISSTQPLPEKDFKAVVEDGRITKVGIEYFDNAMTAQPLYCLGQQDWQVWMGAIERFVDMGRVTCYAENAFNELGAACRLYPCDVQDRLCTEVDTPDDLLMVNDHLRQMLS